MTTLMRLGALALAAFVLQTPATEQGFTQLFNGKDWTGWKVANPAAFRIENGEIIANGTPGHAYYDGPLLNHTLRDFELKVDVMTKPNSNGGIFILTEFQESKRKISPGTIALQAHDANSTVHYKNIRIKPL